GTDFKSYDRGVYTSGILSNHDLSDHILHSCFLDQIVRNDGAAAQSDDAVAYGEYVVETMADQYHYQSTLLQLLDQLEDVLDFARSKSGCGLIHDQHSG